MSYEHAKTVKLTKDQQIMGGYRPKKESSAWGILAYVSTLAAGFFGGMLFKEVKKGK